jgi:hypothetical protein
MHPLLLKRLEKSAEDFMNNPPPDAFLARNLTGYAREYFKEMFMSGEWLAHQLRKLFSCNKKLRESICFAHGQRCFGNRDVWNLAQEQLQKYKEGRADSPGMKLADEIIKETMPELHAAKEKRDQRRKELHAKYTKFVG